MSTSTWRRPGPRRLAVVLLTALLTAVTSLIAAPAATAGPGPVIDPVGPCYLPPRICLSYDRPTRTFTAFSLYDVGPTPYYIQIYVLAPSERVMYCGYGDTCTVTVRLPPNGICYDAKAYIGSWSDVAPPATVISESSTVRYCGRPF